MTRGALELAVGLLLDNADDDNDLYAKAARQLQDILDQRGCEHFDPAVEDGLLTTLIDVIIYG